MLAVSGILVVPGVLVVSGVDGVQGIWWYPGLLVSGVGGTRCWWCPGFWWCPVLVVPVLVVVGTRVGGILVVSGLW